MATALEQYLQHLDVADIKEIVFQTDQMAAASKAGKFLALSQEKFSSQQIIELLKEAGLASKLPSGDGRTSFNHSAGEKHYTVTVAVMAERMQVRFTRADTAQAPVDNRVAPVQAAPVQAADNQVAPIQAPVQSAPAAPKPPIVSSSPHPPSAPDPQLIALLAQARSAFASDLHLSAGQPARIRTAGNLQPSGEAMSSSQVEKMLRSILPPLQHQQFESKHYADFSVDLGNSGGRLRVNASRHSTGSKVCFRLIPNEIPTLLSLGLPREIAAVTHHHQGLAIISGPNCHGKTTTLAAIVGLINSTRPHHVITVEDPVEFVHPIKKSLMSQREVGTHTQSFARALKAALREDPDVIVIGELRDLETVEIALSAAETGHLVLATMSTRSAARTIDRLINMFPPADQPQVRNTLAGALKIIVSQRLLPHTSGQAWVAAAELITGSPQLANLIRENKLLQLPSLQQRGRSMGMIRLDESLYELAAAGKISEEVALAQAEMPKDLEFRLKNGGKTSLPEEPPPAKAPDGALANLAARFGKKGP